VRRVLLVTNDEKELGPTLQGVLVRAGYQVTVSRPEEDALLDVVGESAPEVVVADCREKADCAASIRRLLASECDLKELLVIALLTQEQASEIEWPGIDDFLIAPFAGEELLARLSLLLWRIRKIDSDQVIKIGDLLIDMLNYEASIDGTPIELTFKEYEVLRFLATHRGRVFTREALLNHVWGYDYYGGTRTIDVHIRRLRSKLEPSHDHLIETVRNVGYRFSA
jgi:DNA-binding response OmpR family regulator